MSRAKKYFRVNVARVVRWQLTLILSPSFSLDSSIFYDILFVKLSENFFYFKLSLICFIYLTRNRFIVVWLHQRSSAIRYANIYVGTDNDTIMKLYNYHRGIKWFASEFRTVKGIYWKDQTNSVNEFMQLTCGNLRHLTFSLLNFRNINFHHSKIRLLKPRSAWILKLKTTWTSESSCWFLYETLFITFGSFYKFLTNLLSYSFDMNHKTLKRLSIWKQRNERELQFNKFPGFLVKAANLTIFFSFFVYFFHLKSSRVGRCLACRCVCSPVRRQISSASFLLLWHFIYLLALKSDSLVCSYSNFFPSLSNVVVIVILELQIRGINKERNL